MGTGWIVFGTVLFIIGLIGLVLGYRWACKLPQPDPNHNHDPNHDPSDEERREMEEAWNDIYKRWQEDAPGQQEALRKLAGDENEAG